MSWVRVLALQAGEADFRSGRDRGVLDLPHPDPEARARFSRPGIFPVDALWWSESAPAEAPSEGTPDLEFSVEPHVGWDARTAGIDMAGVVKQVSFLHASEGTSPDEFRARYRAHVELAHTHMPALCQYHQNDVVDVRGARFAVRGRCRRRGDLRALVPLGRRLSPPVLREP